MNPTSTVTDADIGQLLDTPRAPAQPKRESTAADMEFELEVMTPAQFRKSYPAQTQHLIDAARTTHYVCLTCDTRRGPFLCALPIDGHLVPMTPGFTKLCVETAQAELARRFAEEEAGEPR